MTWDHVRGVGGLRAAAEAYRSVRADVSVTWDTRSLQALADQAASSVGRSSESYVWTDRRWALAVDAAAQVAAYRSDLIESGVPRTWDEVEALARTARSRERWIALPAIPTDAICNFLAVCASL